MKASEIMEAPNTGFQLFVDLDGVLCDFESGIQKLLGQYEFEKKDIWKIIHSMPYEEAEDWWANLDWAPGGQELWSYVSKFHPTILSTPDKRPRYREACERGKNRWVREHLHPKPAGVILTVDKWKHANKFSILIDDRKKVLAPWEEHGGAGILHVAGHTKNTIKELISRFGFPKK